MNEWFSDKDPTEILVLSVDFTPLLNGATVTAWDWLIDRIDTTEDTTAMKSGSTDGTAAPIIRQKVIGGTDGGSYLHRAKATLSDTRVLIYGVRQMVRKGA